MTLARRLAQLETKAVPPRPPITIRLCGQLAGETAPEAWGRQYPAEPYPGDDDGLRVIFLVAPSPRNRGSDHESA
jgi:hypothetical protein